MNKISGEETFPCPHCGEPQTQFVLKGKAKTPSCPSCNTMVSPKDVPPDMIVRIKEEPEKPEKVEMTEKRLVQNFGEEGLDDVKWGRLESILEKIKGIGEKTIADIKTFWDMGVGVRRNPYRLDELLDDETSLSRRRIQQIVEAVFAADDEYSYLLEGRKFYSDKERGRYSGSRSGRYGEKEGYDLERLPPELRSIVKEKREKDRAERQREALGIDRLEKQIGVLTKAMQALRSGGDGGGGGEGGGSEEDLKMKGLKYSMMEDLGLFERLKSGGGGGSGMAGFYHEIAEVGKEAVGTLSPAFMELAGMLSEAQTALNVTLMKEMGVDPEKLLGRKEAPSWGQVEETFKEKGPKEIGEKTEEGEKEKRDIREIM